MIEAWKNSSQVVKVFVKTVYSGMTILVGNPNSGKYIVGAKGTFHPTRGYWHFYIPRSKFLYGGETLYEIDAVDIEKNARHVLGDGILRIRTNALDIEESEEGNVPDSNAHDAYVKDDVNGNWFLISVDEAEDGDISLSLKSIVTENVPQDVSGIPYAYNKKTGLYHKVTVSLDDTGTPSLDVSSVGVEGETASIVFNPTTGLYYGLEVGLDDSGAMAIQVGDKQ